MTDGQTLSQQIDALKQAVLNLQAMADRARAKGDFVGAQDLNTQAVALSGKLNGLSDERRDQAFASAGWQALSAHLDALNSEAQDTQGQMQSAEDNVETAKTIVGLVGKLATVL